MIQRRRLAFITTVLLIVSFVFLIRSWISVSNSFSLQQALASKNHTLLSYPRCAPWIPAEQRVIAFEAKSWLQTWKSYHSSLKVYHGGEAYWSASLDHVLQQLEFRVVRRNMNPSLLKDMRDGKIFKFIFNSNAPNNYPSHIVNHKLFGNSNITCRWHWLDWWAGNVRYNPNATREQEWYNPFPSDSLQLGFDARHVLAPLPGSTNTPISYIVHSQVTLPPIILQSTKKKPRAGFLLSKHCQFDIAVVRALLNAGFTLYTTCFDSHEQVQLEQQLGGTTNGSLVHCLQMLPMDFSRLLRAKVAFLIGFGAPPDSPSPYEALANGAAYLQMKCACAETCRVGATQHLALRNLGYPYVYTYTRFCNDTNTASSVMEAAERAYNNPFPSYIPSQHSLGTVLSQVCTNLIESTALCDCARLQERLGTDTEEKMQEIETCRSGSFYEVPLVD